jgi:hypothetical protein
MYDIPNAAQVEGILHLTSHPGVDFGSPPGKANLGGYIVGSHPGVDFGSPPGKAGLRVND